MQAGYNPFSYEPIVTRKGVISKIPKVPHYFTHRSRTERVWDGDAFTIDMSEIEIMKENNVKKIIIKHHKPGKNVIYEIKVDWLNEMPTRNHNGNTEKIILVKNMIKVGEAYD